MSQMWRGTPPKFDILNLRVEKNRNLLGAIEIQGRGQGVGEGRQTASRPVRWAANAGFCAGRGIRTTFDQRLPRRETP
jgi:hypothetical protein